MSWQCHFHHPPCQKMLKVFPAAAAATVSYLLPIISILRNIFYCTPNSNNINITVHHSFITNQPTPHSPSHLGFLDNNIYRLHTLQEAEINKSFPACNKIRPFLTPTPPSIIILPRNMTINCPSIFEYQYYYYSDGNYTAEVVISHFMLFSSRPPTVPTHCFMATPIWFVN